MFEVYYSIIKIIKLLYVVYELIPNKPMGSGNIQSIKKI